MSERSASGPDHEDACVVHCTNAGNCPPHACWCNDGNLSFSDFGSQHPLWLTLPATHWLDSDEGSAWDARMRGTTAERIAQHTPGPWRAINRSSDGLNDPFLGWDIEGPPQAERGQFANAADARLIAAAPELLETAKWGLDLIEMYDSFLIRLGEPEAKVYSQTHLEGLRRAREIIAKAEGRA